MPDKTYAELLIDCVDHLCELTDEQRSKKMFEMTQIERDAIYLGCKLSQMPEEYKQRAIAENWSMERLVEELIP